MEILVPISFITGIVIIVIILSSNNHSFKMQLLEKSISSEDLKELLQGHKKRRYDWSGTSAILQLGMLCLFVGIGIAIGEILYIIFEKDSAYPAAIFASAGIGLIGSYYMHKEERKKQDQKDDDKP